MSIENNLYNSLYDGFERLQTKAEKFRVEDDRGKIEKLESKFNKISRTFKYIEQGCWVGTTFGLYCLTKELTGANPSETELQTSAMLSIMTSALGTHFHYARKLDELLGEKILGRLIEKADAKEVRKWQNIGRYSHLTAVTTLLTFIGKAGYEIAKEHPIVAGVFGGIGGFCYYHNFIEGYSALYNSMGDFILGERRTKKGEIEK